MRKKGRTKATGIWVYTIDHLSHEFYKPYLMTETKIVTSSDAQDNDLYFSQLYCNIIDIQHSVTLQCTMC